MSWDQTWRLRSKKISLAAMKEAAAGVAQNYEGVEVEVEAEADDCITFFFTAPTDEEEVYATLEVSLYEMGDGTHILSLEGDASDNHGYWDDASQLAEDLAEALGAQPLEL